MISANSLEGLLPRDALRMGLGCSRLGSVGGASKDESRLLLRTALDEGVRFFDTSNIYGQGDSERLLGEVLRGHPDCVVTSKAGKYVAWQRRALVPLKGVLRASARRSAAAKQTVVSARANPMPMRWDGPFLTRSLDNSLKRLDRDRLDIFMLHSPPSEVVRGGAAVCALEQAQLAGKIGLVGVAVDDIETALACLEDNRIKVLQVPLRPATDEFDIVLNAAEAAGVAIVAREILGGVGSRDAPDNTLDTPARRIHDVVRNPRVAIPLIGATRLVTLRATVEAVRSAMSGNA